MINTIEINYKKFDHIKLYINEELVKEQYDCNDIIHSFDQ